MANDAILYRSFQFQREWLDEEKRESIISFSSEEEISRWDMVEILDHSAKAVNLKWLREIGAHLFNHDRNQIIGPILEAKVENGRGIARVGYDNTDEGNLAFERTKSGSLRGASVGYRVHEWKALREGEEYQLATKKIKAQKGQDIYIATKWTPIEITSTPVPADSSVGHGRDLFIRSLQEAGVNLREESIVDEKDVQKIVDDSIKRVLPDAVKEGVKSALPEIRSVLTEERKPQMRIEVAMAQDLTNRASAISQECEVEVSRMIFHGKTEQEVTRFILDKATGKTDAKDNGGQGGDPTKRLIDDKNKQNQIGQIRSFKQIEDDQFFATILNPAQLPM